MEETHPKNLFLRHARNNWIDMAASPVQLSPKSKTKDGSSPSKGLSPMSVLANDLSSANLADSCNLKRRLSLCSQSGSPSPSPLQLGQRRPKDFQDANASFDSLPRSPLSSQNLGLDVPCKENNPQYTHLPKDSPKSRTHSDLSGKDDPASFKFAQPNRLLSLKNTPTKKENSSVHGSPGSKLFRCLSSGSESIDDGFLEFFIDKENDSMSPSVPSGMGSLLSGQIVQRSPLKQSSPFNLKNSAKRSLHRSLSVNDFDTPTSSKGAFFKSPSFSNFQEAQPSSMDISSRPFKRPEPISENDDSSNQPPSKRRRNLSPLKDNRGLMNKNDSSPMLLSRGALTQSSLLNYGFQKNKSPSVKFQRSFSDTDAIIKNSVERSSVDSLLVGDFSRSFVLPLMNGKHTDLKTIHADTLAALLKGNYDAHIDSYSIVDCRYPYEYKGGHIKGSQNLFTRDHINDSFINGSKGQPPSLSTAKRHVLIFHCEFSSERAPCLSRYLRNTDRQMNKECYPQLYYPEVYLLHGGYKAFHEAHPFLCEPKGYVPMLNQGNEADLRHFRAKSRSWAGDIKQPATSRMLPNNFSMKRLDV